MQKPMYHKSPEEAALFTVLRRRVQARVNAVQEDRGALIKIKVILLPVVYFGCYLAAVLQAENPQIYFALFAVMGILLVLIYLNIIHEAAHNNIFKNKKYNRAVLKIFDLVGANSFIWERRHIVSHHAYPNVDGWDTDIEQSGVLKIYPYGKAKGIQKYQHRFFFLVYPLYLFNWMFIRDFRDFFGKSRIIRKFQPHIAKREKLKLLGFKSFYFFYQIVAPILFFKVAWTVALGAWALQILVAGTFALFVLLPLHAVPENRFPLTDDQKQLPYSWLRHQFEVTNDLTESNPFFRYILGNFNYHVAHHLFPNYSYEYYPEITDEIRSYAAEKGLRYKRFPLFTALRMHYRLLKNNATSIGEMMEETM